MRSTARSTTLVSTLALALALTLGSACDGGGEAEAAKDGKGEAKAAGGAAAPAQPEAGEPGNDPAELGGKAPFDFASAGACDMILVAQVAGVYGQKPEAVTAKPEGEAKPHRKRCRYTWQDGGVEVALTIAVEAKREGPAAERWLEPMVAARGDGLPVIGRDGATQTFTAVNGLGDEALYSGNVEDSKALFARLDERYLVTLQHHQFGKDTGDQKANLVALARPIVGKLARK